MADPTDWKAMHDSVLQDCLARERERDQARRFLSELRRQLREGVGCLTCGTRFHQPDLDAPCPVCRARAEVEHLRQELEATKAELGSAVHALHDELREGTRLRNALGDVRGMCTDEEDHRAIDRRCARALDPRDQRCVCGQGGYPSPCPVHDDTPGRGVGA